MCLPLSFRLFSSIIFAAFVLCENVVNQKIALYVFYEFSNDNFEAVIFRRKSVKSDNDAGETRIAVPHGCF